MGPWPLAEQTVASFGRQILEAMRFLQSVGLPCVHVHAGNVLLDGSGHCRLSEVELALLRAPSAGEQLARPARADEPDEPRRGVAEAGSATADVRLAGGWSIGGDVVAFGHLLFELLTGREFTEQELLNWRRALRFGQHTAGPPCTAAPAAWHVLRRIFVPEALEHMPALQDLPLASDTPQQMRRNRGREAQGPTVATLLQEPFFRDAMDCFPGGAAACSASASVSVSISDPAQLALLAKARQHYGMVHAGQAPASEAACGGGNSLPDGGGVSPRRTTSSCEPASASPSSSPEQTTSSGSPARAASARCSPVSARCSPSSSDRSALAEASVKNGAGFAAAAAAPGSADASRNEPASRGSAGAAAPRHASGYSSPQPSAPRRTSPQLAEGGARPRGRPSLDSR